MRIEDQDIERQLHDSRLATAASLERAASMLPPDPVVTATLEHLQASCLDDKSRSHYEQLTLALDRLERAAGDAAMPREFWVILQDAAVQEALYEQAHRYKRRAEAA